MEPCQCFPFYGSDIFSPFKDSVLSTLGFPEATLKAHFNFGRKEREFKQQFKEFKWIEVPVIVTHKTLASEWPALWAARNIQPTPNEVGFSHLSTLSASLHGVTSYCGAWVTEDINVVGFVFFLKPSCIIYVWGYCDCRKMSVRDYLYFTWTAWGVDICKH